MTTAELRTWERGSILFSPLKPNRRLLQAFSQDDDGSPSRPDDNGRRRCALMFHPNMLHPPERSVVGLASPLRSQEAIHAHCHLLTIRWSWHNFFAPSLFCLQVAVHAPWEGTTEEAFHRLVSRCQCFQLAAGDGLTNACARTQAYQAFPHPAGQSSLGKECSGMQLPISCGLFARRAIW